jgi:hypothetical protein
MQETRKHVLDPVDRLSEILFGLIMVLTFTGSLSVATAERSDVREMLIGAIGCNLAWGLIDAIMYLMACLTERGTTYRTLRAIQAARSPEEAHAAIRRELPDVVARELQQDDIERIRASILSHDASAAKPSLTRTDLRGALSVFLIVVASTFPVVLPFVFIQDAASAMRLSNAIAVAMLAMIGFGYGKVAGLSPWLMGSAMVVLGAVLVSITIALGG